jgi:hypothetical protein
MAFSIFLILIAPIIASLIIWFKNKKTKSVWLKRLYWCRVIIFVPLIVAVIVIGQINSTGVTSNDLGILLGRLLIIWLIIRKWAK